MKPCPNCRHNAWDDKLYGLHPCPNCRTTYRLTKSMIELPVSYRKLVKAPKANRDNVVIGGMVMCACCHRPTPLNDCVDGRIESSGTKPVSVQIGWTFTGSLLIPAFESRHLPKVIRGLLCSECFISYQGQEVLTADVRLKRKRSLPFEKSWQANCDINGGRLYAPPLDPDPTWAHTGDCGWLRRMDNAATIHLPECGCPKCMGKACGQLEQARMVASITGQVTLEILKGPLAHYTPGPLPAIAGWQLPDMLMAIVPIRPQVRRMSAIWTAYKCKHGMAVGCAMCKPNPTYTRQVRRRNRG